MEEHQAFRSWSVVLVIMLAAWCGNSLDAFAQKTTKPAAADPAAVSPAANAAKLSIEQEQALALIRQLASELKSEADKSSAALIQAQAADVLWKFNEIEARSLFRLAFDSANQPIPETSTIDKDEKTRHLKLLQQQASVVQSILTLFSKHDQASAETWLESLKKDKRSTNQDSPAQFSQDRGEFLAQVALQEVRSNSEESLKFALLSLSAPEIPAAVGQVIIVLKNIDRAKGDILFEATLAALRRNVYSAGTILTYLSNYLFFSNGTLFDRSDAAHAARLIDYLVDVSSAELARWQQLRENNRTMPDSAAFLLNFLGFRGLGILKVNAPEKFFQVQSVFNELSIGLNQQQRDTFNQLTASHLSGTSDAGSDLDAALQKVESEKNPVVRDDMRRTLALRIMRDNPEQALSIASRIDDSVLKAQTEDDINLILASHIPRGAYVEARRVFAKFHDQSLRDKCLIELAARTYSISHNREESLALFGEAYDIALKIERAADRAEVLLLLAEKVNSLDPERTYEFLSAAIKAVNQAKDEAVSTEHPSRRGFRTMSFTMFGSLQLSPGNHATLDSLSFNEVAPLICSDYFRARNLGDDIQHKITRARYLLALARNTLDSLENKARLNTVH